MFQDLLVKTFVEFAVPELAGFLKPYLTLNAESLVVTDARALLGKLPVPAQKYAGWAVDALASAWGVH